MNGEEEVNVTDMQAVLARIQAQASAERVDFTLHAQQEEVGQKLNFLFHSLMSGTIDHIELPIKPGRQTQALAADAARKR